MRQAAYDLYAPMGVGGKSVEPLDAALGRRARVHGKGKSLPAAALEPYLCDTLGLGVAELRRLDHEAIAVQVAWREGKALGEWVASNPRLGPRERGPR